MTVVHTIGTASRDFSTIEGWITSLPATLVDNVEGQCFNDSEFTPAGNAINFSGITVGSFTITLKCGAGQSFRDNANASTNALTYNQANGVGINCSAYGGGTFVIKISVPNVILDGLQFKNTAASSGGCITTVGSVSGYALRNLLIDNKAGTALSLADASNAGTNVYNCLLISRTGSGIAATDSTPITYLTIVRQSDLVSTGTGFSASNYASANVIVANNVAVFGFTTAFSNPTTKYSSSCSNLGSDSATFPTGSTSNQGSLIYANQFQGTASTAMDFRLKTGAALIDTGVAKAGITTTDIIGTTRPQGAAPDIGCSEFITGTVGSVLSAGWFMPFPGNTRAPEDIISY